MQAKGNRWLFPRRDDPLNLFLWRLAPWLAGIEWALIIIGSIFTPTCGAEGTVSWLGFAISLFIPLTLFIVSVRALASGGYPCMGSWILSATNGTILLMLAASMARFCIEYYL